MKHNNEMARTHSFHQNHACWAQYAFPFLPIRVNTRDLTVIPKCLQASLSSIIQLSKSTSCHYMSLMS